MYRNEFGRAFTEDKVYIKDIRYAIVEEEIAEDFEMEFNTRIDELEEKNYHIINTEITIYETKYVGLIEYCYKDYVYTEKGGDTDGEQQVQEYGGRTTSSKGTEGEEERGD